MRILARTRTLAFSCALTFAASATAGPLIPLDSEQKAASAIVAGMRIQHSSPGQLQVFMGQIRVYAEEALDALAVATTPEALTQIRGGLTLPCALGGSFNARNSKSAPQVLEIDFADCIHRFDRRTVTGPMRLALLSNSFDAEEFASIRVGTRELDLVADAVFLTPDQDTYVTTRYNFRMEGHIEVFRTFLRPDQLPEESLFEINGFWFEDFRADIPGRERYARTLTMVADHILVSTSTDSDAEGLLVDEQTTFHWGSFQLDFVEPTGSGFERQEFQGLSVHRITDYAGWTDSLELDGGVRHIWSQHSGRGCLSGNYLFDTVTPLHRPDLNGEAFDAGELVINRDVNVRLYSPGNVPAGLPVPVNGMLTRVDVNGVGTFDYDARSFDTSLWSVAQCPY